jgi:hypothetical protein
MRWKLNTRLLAFQIPVFGISLVVAMGLLFLIDTLLGAFAIVPTVGLVLPPSRRVTYRTPEFVYEVATNSLGFRDREFNAAREPRPRIVALGDSFTYGWGGRHRGELAQDSRGQPQHRGKRRSRSQILVCREPIPTTMLRSLQGLSRVCGQTL